MAIGVFSSHQLETATHESLPFRFVAGGLHPDRSTVAEFRKTFLAEITELFVQMLVLVLAHEEHTVLALLARARPPQRPDVL